MPGNRAEAHGSWHEGDTALGDGAMVGAREMPMVVLKWIVLTLVLLAVIAAALMWWGNQRWNGLTQQLLQRLEAARVPTAPARIEAAEIATLPAPVQRYLSAVLKTGAPFVAALQVEQRGSFNLSEQGEQWRPFTATHRVVTRRPGFVWDARVSMMPGLAVHVHDAYVAGEGLLRPAVAGLFTLMELRGSGEVALGELMRYLAEACWYPSALLPSQGVSWEAVDEASARATLVDGHQRASLLFRFDAEGLIESVYSPGRGRTVGGQVVTTPWEGRWSNYQTHEGMRVPMGGEVAWLIDGRRQTYWRGSVTSLHYEMTR